MRTRLIVIGAFVCLVVLLAAFVASLYTQARHIPCVWSAQNCGLLNNVLSAGAVLRGCAIVLLAQGVTRLTLRLWRWRAHEQIKWASTCADMVLLLLLVALVWGLSQAALDAYGYFYGHVPADAPHDAQTVVDFDKSLDKAMLDSARLAALFVWAAGLEMGICIYKLWKAFEIEELDHEIAIHEEHLRHERAETTD
jgi:nitrate reductase gamma subunit